MIKIKKKGKICGLFLVSLIMLGLSLSVFSENSSAIADYSETITTTSGDFFSNCNLSCLQQYNYLILSWDYVNSNSFIPLTFRTLHNGTTASTPAYFSSRLTFAIIDISELSSTITWDGTPPSGLSLTATLSEDYQSCPEIEPCPVIPDYPYEDDLASIKNAILLCGGAILVIYFFYAIYKMILGGL